MNAEGILHLLGEEYTPNAEGFLLFSVFFSSRFGILTNPQGMLLHKQEP
jgi:hypothetical protein